MNDNEQAIRDGDQSDRAYIQELNTEDAEFRVNSQAPWNVYAVTACIPNAPIDSAKADDGMLRVTDVDYTDTWAKVKKAARTTISKDGTGKYPTARWKKQILLAEHSPIRKIRFGWKWQNLKSWISVHFVRHKIGIEHWVSTQRNDRTGIDRDSSPQSTLVSHEAEADAQALIYISRKRMCMQAHAETRAAWMKVRDEVKKCDPILAEAMVPECIYRGFCPEFKSCGFCETQEYRDWLTGYRNAE